MAQTTIKQRQIAGGLDGWIPAEETWTYASASTFTISGDKTDKYQKGDKVKLTQTTAKYFYIVGVSESGGTTTVTVTGGSDYTLADAVITSPYFSKVENPQGFPHWFSWTITFTGFSSDPTGYTARFFINGNMVFIRVAAINGTSNASTMTMSLPVTATYFALNLGRVRDNNVMNEGHCYIASGDYTVVVFGKDPVADGGFTTSGTKGAQFELFYEF